MKQCQFTGIQPIVIACLMLINLFHCPSIGLPTTTRRTEAKEPKFYSVSEEPSLSTSQSELRPVGLDSFALHNNNSYPATPPEELGGTQSNHNESSNSQPTLFLPAFHNNGANNGSITARQIVEHAYQEIFSSLAKNCPPSDDFKTCLRRMQDQKTSNQAWPWWFHTMLRDAYPKENPADLFGFWHNLTFGQPRIDFCAIEKIGTKHWRKVQCKMNAPEKLYWYSGQPCQADPETMSTNASKAVFLRDPLERFLSGFLDKCVNTHTRKVEGHCEPKEVFRVNDRLLPGIIEDKRRFFEAYVDTMPLKWNVHFFPQSFYCDGLFRHFINYDVVGHMGPSFYEDVHEFGMQYSDYSNFSNALDYVFKIKKRLTQGKGNRGVETSASSYVQKYYTQRTLTKVLQYMSIDYVLLDIPIPSWAERMLELGNEQPIDDDDEEEEEDEPIEDYENPQ